MTERPAFALADHLVDAIAALSPSMATFMGVPGHDHRWDDFGPDGVAARQALWTQARAEVDALPPTTDRWEALARATLRDQADAELELITSGDHHYDLNPLSSTLQVMRMVFDTMPADTEAAREAIRRRLLGLDAACTSYRALLAEGLALGRVVARRQVEVALGQAAAAIGPEASFARAAGRCVAADPAAEPAMIEALAAANAAYSALADWLRTAYLPHAGDDPVGRARYTRAAARHLGMTIDPEDAYAWGWAEITRIEEEMVSLAEALRPGHTTSEVLTWLQTAPEWLDPTADTFIARMQARQEDARDRLDGVHFAIPPQARTLQVARAPRGGTIGAYYMPPGDGFSRPGSVWYALEADTDIPWFDEVSTAYHEGFPGHHLQIATAVAQAEQLSRLARVYVSNTGHAEGWALYAEQLMHELGFLDHPALVLGMHVGQLVRAWRVVVDIGLHLQLTVPTEATFHPGERWSPALAVEAMHTRAGLTAATARAEVDRYLGWPGQAICYKLGQRVMLALRAEDRARAGAAWDPRRFHARLLELGTVRLDRLQAELRAGADEGMR